MFVGDSGVGKTTLINYFVNEEENILLNKTQETNCVDLYFKKIKIKEGSLLLNLNIWDFSGKLSESKVRSEFYAELHAIVYMFDLSNLLTFNSLESWIRETKRNGGEKLIPVILGGKSDLKREITSGMVEDFLNKYKFNYYELNVKDMSCVKKFFHEFSNNAYELKPKERIR